MRALDCTFRLYIYVYIMINAYWNLESSTTIVIIFGEQMPIEEISNWLNPTDDGTNNSLQSLRERFLEIYYSDYCYPIPIQNAREMLEHLTKVYFIHFMARPIITYIFNFNFQHNNRYNIFNCCGSN